MSRKKLDRRQFLRLAPAAAAATIAPTLWIPRRARAATTAFGAARHVLILFAKGGLRSHALFNAVGTGQHNPWGAQAAAAGTEWTLGAVCGAEGIASSALGALGGITAISSDISVLACVDHDPNGVPDVDHDTASYLMAGGEVNAAPSLLARIGRDHPRYADGFSLDAVPPVEIVPSEFGHGSGDYARARPIQVRSPTESFGASGNAAPDWAKQARASMADRFASRAAAPYASRVANFTGAKRTLSLFAPMLSDPLLDIAGAPDADDGNGGLTNQQLREILGGEHTGELGDPEPRASWSAGVSQALRFFHFGSPLAVVTNDIYDLHGDEDTKFAPRAKDLVRQLVGLNHALKAMTHPLGGTYWDSTVVAVVSEFSRNNTDPSSGFNSGRGSDHVLESPAPMRNQAIALMGGPIVGGRLIGSTDAEMRATGPVFRSRRVLSTFLDLLGMSHEPHWPDEPIAELY